MCSRGCDPVFETAGYCSLLGVSAQRLVLVVGSFRKYHPFGVVLELPNPMFCPNCRAEYIHGVTRCSDCDLALVDRLPEPDRDADGELLDAKLKEVWSGVDQSECVAICKQLRDAGIPFKVNQHSKQFLKGIDEHYAIGVPPEFCNHVEEILERGRLAITDEADDLGNIELPEQDTLTDPACVEKSADSASWDPEDATVNIWTEQTSGNDSMVELSLRENNINYRMDVLDSRSRKIYVAPSDEPRAREIVLEIENGIPPK